MIPWTAACQVPLSMGFSRQEYWSGLPCPPPGDLPNPGIESRSPTLQADSLLTEPSGKPKNTGVGSLSLLQGIFPTSELNRDPLHCSWILYELSNQRIPGTLNRCSIMAFFKCLELGLSVEEEGLVSCGSRGRLRTSGIWLPGGSFAPRVERPSPECDASVYSGSPGRGELSFTRGIRPDESWQGCYK